jgi:3-hydroxyacyl-CoA dehydrogenase/enoyl-CoA hydratase/3-hydroxybutyryl-CoA epimerase
MTPTVTHRVDDGGVGWITFDDPFSGVNVFNLGTLDALDSAITALTSPVARAIIVISAKERIFIAGADLKWLMGLSDVELAEEFAATGQHLFQRLAAMPVPVVCAIHGTCAGGGFELALACHYRIASDGLQTQIGLPEVGIGTLPGWGGCVRLPRLIGPAAALDHILKAQLLPADEALRAGLVDEVVPAAGLRARALQVALELAAGGPPARPAPPVPPAAYFDDLRESVRKRTRGQLPAPLAAVNAVEQGSRLDLGFAFGAEAAAFAKVTAGPVCKNLVNGFFLREAARKRTLEGWFPATSARPAPVRRVGVVGAGVMGSGIAHLLAARGFEVALRDVLPEFLERGLEVIGGLFNDAVARGRLSADDARERLGRISTTTSWVGFGTCDLVIEAIEENARAKQRLFAEVSRIVRPDTLLASSSAALPVEEAAGQAPHPERALGMHFFNPVGRTPLVELVLGSQTSSGAAERALAFLKAIGKSPVICRSSPGILVTRILHFHLNEAVRLWEQGMPTAAVDSAMREFGWQMGPLRLIDELGVDATDFAFGQMERYFPQRFARTGTCSAMLAARLRGRKYGAGFYTYSGGSEAVNDEATRSLAAPVGTPPVNSREIAARLMGAMVAEARRCLDERVVLAQDDVDFALVAGAGFPPSRGGLMRYANRTGGSAAPFL